MDLDLSKIPWWGWGLGAGAIALVLFLSRGNDYYTAAADNESEASQGLTNTDLEGRFTDITSQLDSLGSVITGLDEQTQTQGGLLSQLTGALGTLSGTVDTLAGSISTQAGNIDSLDKKLSSLEDAREDDLTSIADLIENRVASAVGKAMPSYISQAMDENRYPELSVISGGGGGSSRPRTSVDNSTTLSIIRSNPTAGQSIKPKDQAAYDKAIRDKQKAQRPDISYHYSGGISGL